MLKSNVYGFGMGGVHANDSKLEVLQESVTTNSADIDQNTLDIDQNMEDILQNDFDTTQNTIDLIPAADCREDLLTLAQKTNTTISSYTATANPTANQVGYQVGPQFMATTLNAIYDVPYSYGLPPINEGVWLIEGQIEFGLNPAIRAMEISQTVNAFDTSDPSYKSTNYTNNNTSQYMQTSRVVVIPPGGSAQYYITAMGGNGIYGIYQFSMTAYYTLTRLG